MRGEILRWSHSRTKLAIGVTVAVLTGVIVLSGEGRASSASQSGVKWDAKAADELKHELMKLHDALNAMDIEAIKRAVTGDDVLVTFDVDPDTGKPVKLRTKDDIIEYTERFFSGLRKTGAKSKAEHPMIACRVASNFGVCTEECKVELTNPDGTKHVQLLRATVLAYKAKDGWKWMQWHMSDGSGDPI